MRRGIGIWLLSQGICWALVTVANSVQPAHGDPIKAAPFVKGGDRVGARRVGNSPNVLIEPCGLTASGKAIFDFDYFNRNDSIGVWDGSRADLILGLGDMFAQGRITRIANAPFQYAIPAADDGEGINVVIPVEISGSRDAILQFVAGKLITLAVLPDDKRLIWPPKMNPSGLVVYTVRSTNNGGWLGDDLATYVSDSTKPQPRRLDPEGAEAFRGSDGRIYRFSSAPAGSRLDPAPSVNAGGGIVFSTQVAAEDGRTVPCIVYREPGGKMHPVIVSGWELSDAHVCRDAKSPRLYEDGSVAYLSNRKADDVLGVYSYSVYRWDRNSRTTHAVLSLERDPSGRLPVEEVNQIWVNPRNPKVLLQARKLRDSADGLYVADGSGIRQVFVPDQTELPGGGTATFLPPFEAIGPASPAGIRLLGLAGSTGSESFLGLYAMDPDGGLSLVAKPGMQVDLEGVLGTIWSIGAGTAGPTADGQFAVSLVVRQPLTADREEVRYVPYLVLLRP